MVYSLIVIVWYNVLLGSTSGAMFLFLFSLLYHFHLYKKPKYMHALFEREREREFHIKAITPL